MSVFITHPTGNQNVRAVLKALVKSGKLAKFGTTLAADPSATWLRLLPTGMRQEWLRRTFPIGGDQIWTHPVLEVARMVLPKIGLSYYARHEKGMASVDAVYRNFDMAASRQLLKLKKECQINAVYAYEDGALATFIKAKELGLKCIYDLPIAYWQKGRELMLQEAARLPIWAATLGGGIIDSNEKLDRKTRELELADLIVCPGQFVRDSIPAWASNKKTVMAPFGSPQLITDGKLNLNKEYDVTRPLRILFAGSMGQRKGLGDLFAAIKLLNRKDIELVVMGSLLAPMEFYRNELSDFTYEPGRPNEQVLALMRSCDVFCLPSIVEGRALVTQEAMSQGLPVIITANTGGEDMVIEGVTGFLVPVRSPEAIAQKINWFIEHRSQIPEMGKMAKLHAQKYTWENYGMQIIEAIDGLFT